MKKRRLLAGLVDYLIACFIQAVLMIWFVALPLLLRSGSADSRSILLRNLLITLCSLFYLFIRDNLGRRSIGKRIFKLRIVVKGTNEQAGFAKRLLRNCTWPLGFVEIIILLVWGERLGDRLARTAVTAAGNGRVSI
jgi:uncharacterized RDD family membrane protein YckC